MEAPPCGSPRLILPAYPALVPKPWTEQQLHCHLVASPPHYSTESSLLTGGSDHGSWEHSVLAPSTTHRLAAEVQDHRDGEGTSSLAWESWLKGPKNKGHKAFVPTQALERGRLSGMVPQGATTVAQLSPVGQWGWRSHPQLTATPPGAESRPPSAVRGSEEGAGREKGGRGCRGEDAAGTQGGPPCQSGRGRLRAGLLLGLTGPPAPQAWTLTHLGGWAQAHIPGSPTPTNPKRQIRARAQGDNKWGKHSARRSGPW